MTARVAWISIAPVKGLALVAQESVLLEELGVRTNRRFYLVDEDGRMRNGKQLGALFQVVPEVRDDGDWLSLRFPRGEVLAGDVEVAEPLTTSFFGRPVDGQVVVGPWADALSELAGIELRLARVVRPGEGTDRGRSAAASLVSTASLDELARVAGLPERVDGRRFRMLFGVDGVGAHEEDTWLGRRVRLGEAVVRPLGNAGRCVVTTRDPDTGVRDLRTLDLIASYRGDLETTERLAFGVWGEVVSPGRVAVDDVVEVEAAG
jgi:MOSC domain-containing protein